MKKMEMIYYSSKVNKLFTLQIPYTKKTIKVNNIILIGQNGKVAGNMKEFFVFIELTESEFIGVV